MAGKLGEYSIIADIAEGAFGKVKLAIHTLTGQRVALKCIRKASVNATFNPKAKVRVAREIEYLQLIKHPHCIKLYEVINTPTEVILVTEYAGGELFRFIVENRNISEEQARRFFQQIMSAISYLHSIGIVHRDIKPENVLLDEDTLDVKLADLGLSNEITDGDFLRTWCGSANYAAPEVISNLPYPGPEIDVWSAGVLLYLLLCGRLPFEDEHAPTLYQKITYGVYELPPWLSPDTRYLISRMLVVDPVKRITVPEILAHPWTHRGLPNYLTKAVTTSGAPSLVGTLSSLVKADNVRLPEFGDIDEEVTDYLARRIGVPGGHVVTSLGLDGENAVKVAYRIAMDRKQSPKKDLNSLLQHDHPGHDNTDNPWLADPSTVALDATPRLRAVQTSGSGTIIDDADEEDDEEQELMSHVDIDWTENHFQVLHTSLVLGEGEEASKLSQDLLPLVLTPYGPRPHVLKSYKKSVQSRSRTEASRSRRGKGVVEGLAELSINMTQLDPPPTQSSPPTIPEVGGVPTSTVATAVAAAALVPVRPPLTQAVSNRTKPRPPKWNLGIRSQSPPMEIMHEVYKSLKKLGAEWREKRHPWSFQKFPYPPAPDGVDDITINSDIFFVETRWIVRGHYVRVDIQLYMMHASSYLLDFRNVGHSPLPRSYSGSEIGSIPSTPVRASSDATTITNPQSNRQTVQYGSPTSPTMSYRGGGDNGAGGPIGPVKNPFLFLECAMRLISDLAGE